MGRLPSDFWIVHTFPLALGCAIGYPKRTKMTEGAGTVKFQRITALLLAVCLCLTLIGCGNRSGGAYTMIETLTEGQYAIGFRNGDPAAEYVQAALKVLSAQGRIGEISVKWFGRETASFEADAGALGAVGQPQPRTFIMGMDPDNFPMSYIDSNVYMGFDVDVAKAVCELLGWELKFQEIGDESDAYVELSSGNVDCVWGGMLLDPAETRYQVVCPYMDGGVVVVVLSGSHLGSMRRLSGKVIGMNDAAKYADALALTDLSARAGEIRVTDAGNETVFDNLYKGNYDAIITDYAAAMYYMRDE